MSEENQCLKLTTKEELAVIAERLKRIQREQKYNTTAHVYLSISVDMVQQAKIHAEEQE
jgi:hypothetical protein